ncbi:class I SAM-dependent DNA methyltransferase [Arenimonas sp. MALMAid1274]|uniref:class I SAM-dependent DNA methyltransferase n=1 Tax=Arenimonas sp. MALMAid1274 TaxID=3411630 RepID=UPI003BA1D6A1
MDSHKDAKYHDSIAPEYDRVVVEPRQAALHRLFAPALRRLGAHAPFPVMFDLGCGTGHMVLRAGALAKRVVGVDHSAGMLAIAREKAAAAGLAQSEFVQQDIPAFLQAHPRQADLITAVGVLHHLGEARLPATLAAIRDALRPGGWLLLAEPVADGDIHEPDPIRAWNRRSLAVGRDYSAPAPDPDEAPLPPALLREAILGAGLQIVDQRRGWEIYNHSAEPGLIERLRIGWLQRRFGDSGFIQACLARKPAEG